MPACQCGLVWLCACVFKHVCACACAHPLFGHDEHPDALRQLLRTLAWAPKPSGVPHSCGPSLRQQARRRVPVRWLVLIGIGCSYHGRRGCCGHGCWLLCDPRQRWIASQWRSQACPAPCAAAEPWSEVLVPWLPLGPTPVGAPVPALPLVDPLCPPASPVPSLGSQCNRSMLARAGHIQVHLLWLLMCAACFCAAARACQVVQAFLSGRMCGIGDALYHLELWGLRLTYAQQAVDELDYGVHSLQEDLRCAAGAVLVRV